MVNCTVTPCPILSVRLIRSPGTQSPKGTKELAPKEHAQAVGCQQQVYECAASDWTLQQWTLEDGAEVDKEGHRTMEKCGSSPTARHHNTLAKIPGEGASEIPG